MQAMISVSDFQAAKKQKMKYPGPRNQNLSDGFPSFPKMLLLSRSIDHRFDDLLFRMDSPKKTVDVPFANHDDAIQQSRFMNLWPGTLANIKLVGKYEHM